MIITDIFHAIAQVQPFVPVTIPENGQLEPMYLLHPALKEPLAEQVLPLLSLEDLANLRASCRAAKNLVDSATPTTFQPLQLPTDPQMTPMPTMPSPFQYA